MKEPFLVKKNCVAVPIYKAFSCLNRDELLSLNQLFKILGDYDIYFICGHSFNPDKYLKKAEELNTSPKIKKFSDSFFLSVNGYNKLMCSIDFYKTLHVYEYLLIYQLDAFVFRNELDDWCKKGYDYIGAPWFEGWNEGHTSSQFIGVGNGGFSLRKIDSTLKLLIRLNRLLKVKFLWKRYKLYNLIPYLNLVSKFKNIFCVKNIELLRSVFSDSDKNEDYYISQILGNAFNDYKVASYAEAVKFSFEVNPSLLYSINQNKLPFGCHAWEKYEPEFWKKFIH